MFNCEVESEWKVGSEIIWQGNYQGYDAYQKGEILAIQHHQNIKYSTFDPNFGLEDVPSNYIHVSYHLVAVQPNEVELTVTNETFDGDTKRMEHIQQGWNTVLPLIQRVVVEG